MALPVNVATCTVTGAFVNTDGSIPASGSVTFTPVPARILDATATPPTTIDGTVPVVATLTAGAFTAELPATDSDVLNPTGWTYHVAVRLPTHAYSFCMDAPEGVVDLATVTPIIGSEGDAIIAGPAGPAGAAGEGVPEGGDTGELLAKLSGADFDTDWVPASAPGVHASTHAAGSTDPVTLEQTQVTGLVAGLAAKQPLDSDLTAIAALAPGSDAVIQRKVGMWVASTPTEYKADLALTKSDVGLGNVTNTSDAAKPVSTAQQTALDLKADKTTTITPTAPLTGGGSLAANRTLDISTFTATVKGAVPPPTTATGRFLKDDGTWDTPAGGGGGGITTEDAVDAVATALTEGAAIDIAYNDAANTITVAGVTFTDVAAGIVPLSGGGTSNYLRADGTWTTPPGVAGVSNTATFSYVTTTTEPPTGNQLRLNNTTFSAATRLWVAQTTVDGLDITLGLARILAGHQIYFQDRDDASHWVKYNVTADGIDDGTYYDFTVTYHSGPGAIPAGQIEFQAIAPGTVGVPPGGTSGQALTKSSSTDYAVGWTSVQPLDTDLTTIAGLTATTDHIIQSVGSAWASRTPAQVKTALSLNNVDNTTDALKPVSTATQAALDLKATTAALTAHEADTTAIHGIADTSALVTTSRTASETVTGIVELATTAEATTGTDTARAVTPAGVKAVADTKQPLDGDLTTIAGLTATTDNFMLAVSSAWASRTPAQAKTTLALDNVTNTSDAAKPVSTAQQTALDLKQDKSQTINAQTGTTYTLVLTDAGKIITLSNASAITLTVPTNASVAFPTGTSIDLIQLAAGQFTVTGAGPPTISKAMATAKSRTQYSVLTLIKTATDVWILTGDAAAS